MMKLSLHNLVLLIIYESPWREILLKWLGDIPFLPVDNVMGSDNLARRVLKVYHATKLPIYGMRELDKGILIGSDSLLDRRYGVLLRAPNESEIHLYATNPCLEWLIWSLQLLLLQAHCTFIHAAGIETAGRAILFPSWGGVGKTSLSQYFVEHLGWRLLGDDLVILSEQGICYGFPKPLVIYPYHREIFPKVFANGYGPVIPETLNPLVARLIRRTKPLLRRFPKVLQLAREWNPQSVRIAPSRVYGMQRLALTSRVAAVVWLDRSQESSKPSIIPLTIGAIASKIAGSTLYELDSWCGRLVNVASGVGLLPFRSVYCNWIDTLECGLKEAAAYVIQLPVDIAQKEIPIIVKRMLAELGIV